MSKFKVGDRVEYCGNLTSSLIGRRGKVSSVGLHIIKVNWENHSHAGGVLDESLRLINSSPVREVTRKEIVPGVYGRVRVIEEATGRVAFSMGESGTYHVFNPTELREAATVFNQLADALESGA